jgi:hypothetical protein
VWGLKARRRRPGCGAPQVLSPQYLENRSLRDVVLKSAVVELKQKKGRKAWLSGCGGNTKLVVARGRPRSTGVKRGSRRRGVAMTTVSLPQRSRSRRLCSNGRQPTSYRDITSKVPRLFHSPKVGQSCFPQGYQIPLSESANCSSVERVWQVQEPREILSRPRVPVRVR